MSSSFLHSLHLSCGCVVNSCLKLLPLCLPYNNSFTLKLCPQKKLCSKVRNKAYSTCFCRCSIPATKKDKDTSLCSQKLGFYSCGSPRNALRLFSHDGDENWILYQGNPLVPEIGREKRKINYKLLVSNEVIFLCKQFSLHLRLKEEQSLQGTRSL